mmetsp:Transcript_22416/g.78566  ORF Transcript_22416/g.78566 Transcript_22416/m.78566 type:complete len:502 (-) Transcript_22416:246-1751(-)
MGRGADGRRASKDVSGEWVEERGQAYWMDDAEREEMMRPSRRELRKITPEEVAEHDQPDDMWMIINDKVYNLTAFRLHHPGGRLPLENMAGKDATDPFINYHPRTVYPMMRRYVVGELDDGGQRLEDVSPLMADFRKLRQRLLEEGLYRTSWSFYAYQTVWLAYWFCLSVYLVTRGDETWKRMCGAVTLGIFWQQLAFPGHDTGHNAVTHIAWVDNLIGIFVGNFMGGVSIGWWKWSHNVHHIVCNSVEHDPDIQHLPVFAVTNKIFSRFWSTFHSKWMEMDAPARFFVRWQHWLYYPIMCVARFNLYLQSVILLASDERFPFKRLEMVAQAGFFLWFGYLCSYLPTWGELACFLLLSHGVTGLLHVQITLSHFSMDVYHGYEGHSHNDDDDCWFRMQLATSMDVESNCWTEWLHGGLQYQVEHHLFPRVPRHNLRLLRPMILELCEKHDVEYHLMSFWDANLHVLAQLKRAAEDARHLKPGAAPLDGVPHMLWDGINARG